MDIDQQQVKNQLQLLAENYSLIKQLPDSLANQLLEYETAYLDKSSEIDGSDDTFREMVDKFKQCSFGFIEALLKLKNNMQSIIATLPDEDQLDMKQMHNNFQYFVAEVAEAAVAEHLKEIVQPEHMQNEDDS